MVKFKYAGSAKGLHKELIDSGALGRVKINSNKLWQYLTFAGGTLNFYPSTGTILIQGTEVNRLDLIDHIYKHAKSSMKTNKQNLWFVKE